MWQVAALMCVAVFFFRAFQRRKALSERMVSGPMLGFHWNDPLEAVAKWAKQIGLKYVAANQETACVSYVGHFPGVLPKVSYNFFLPRGRLDSIAAMIEDASGYTFGSLSEAFGQKYGEAWDDGEEDSRTWIAGDLLLVLLQGASGYLHVRYLNMNNLAEGSDLEEEHDKILTGLRAFDAAFREQQAAATK